MVAYGRLIYAKRQDPVPVPSATGIVAPTTASTVAVPTASGLAIDPKASASSGTQSAPPLVATSPSTPDATSVTDSGASSSALDPSSPTNVAVSTSSKPIALSTVIATCIGAFVGVGALIVFSLCVYRRYSRSLEKSGRRRGPLTHRNKQASELQRRARLETWNKLDDDNGDDMWEGSYQTREAKNDAPPEVTPMEKLTMFKKTPSVRTAYTHKSTDAANFSFPSSYAEFDPNLAATLRVGTSEPQARLMNTDSGQISWSESKVNSISSHVSSSLAQNMAIPTPPPTVSHPHKWEAAEVVHYSEGQSAEVVDPFADEEVGSRKSFHNPFFSAQDYVPSRRQRSNSTSTARSRSFSRTRSRANSTATQATQATVVPSSNKGKERMYYPSSITVQSADHTDPFHDLSTPIIPLPPFISHSSSTSTSSKEDRERALKALIAVLDTPEDEVRDRLRIASLQPSIVSATSSIDDSDVTSDFPLPPSTPTMMDFLGGGSLKSSR